MEFLKTQGRRIVSESGAEVLLQGVGLGNWMNPEGFLFGCSEFVAEFRPFMRADGMDRGRSIDWILQETCGKAYAERFWKQYYQNYFAAADIEHLAQLGFNSVRFPLNAKVLLHEEPGFVLDEEAFALLDGLLDACEAHGLYAILDMHAAVSGQSGVACDDGVDNQYHLFTDEEGWERTVRLWAEIAKRYADRAVVAGYELLNEPLCLGTGDRYLPELGRFYDETIAEIRKVDRKHIVFLQGHRFASRPDALRADMDPEAHNWVYTVHLYETWPDLGVLGPILALSDAWNVPVWMGETGGNYAYMAALYEMLYENHIGINIWCQKAVEGADAAALLRFRLPEGFSRISDYAQKGTGKPSFASSQAIFDAYLENIKFENCTVDADIAFSALRRPPFSVPAVAYDMCPGAGVSFQGRYPYSVLCGYRREDRMKIVYEKDFHPYETAAFAFAGPRPPKYGDWMHLELQLREGEFACYTARSLDQPTALSISYRADAPVEIACTLRDAVCVKQLQPSETLRCESLGEIPAGSNTSVKIACQKGTITLHTITFA